MKKKLIFSILLTASLLAMVFGAGSAAAGYRLVAGQNQIIGWVFVENTADTLTVTFETRYGLGFCLQETHLHVADDWMDVPQNNGNPTPGQFDYKGEHNCVRTVSYAIPLAGLDADGDGLLTIAAHAVIGNYRDPDWEETAWGVICGNVDNPDYQFPGGNWAMFTEYPIK